jgi:hypothetical protein
MIQVIKTTIILLGAAVLGFFGAMLFQIRLSN